MKIRLITTVLLVFIIGTVFVSCADTTTDSTNTSNVSGSDTKPADTDLSPFSPVDLGGRDINILCRAPYSGYLNPYREIHIEEMSSIAIEATVYKRNQIIENKYNCNIVGIEVEAQSQILTMVQNDIDSGAHEYDYIMPNILIGIKLATSGYLYDLADVPNIDLSKPWWMGNIIEATSIQNINYFCPNDANIAAMNTVGITHFNKKLAQDYGINPNDLYKLVENGKWTLDKMKEYASNVYEDLNGNNKYDDADVYGLGINSYTWQPFFYGSGSLLIQKDDSDIPVLKATEENNLNILTRIVELANQSSYVYYIPSGNHIQKFSQNQILFWVEAIYGVPTLREMEADFGILPMPKYQEEQDGYYSTIHVNHSSTTAVPLGQDNDLETIGMIIEDMACYSYQHIRPTFFDNMLGGQLVRDEESTKMLDFVYENVVIDLALVFSSSITIDSIMRNALTNNSNTFASTFAKNENVYKTAINNIVDSFNNNKSK